MSNAMKLPIIPRAFATVCVLVGLAGCSDAGSGADQETVPSTTAAPSATTSRQPAVTTTTAPEAPTRSLEELLALSRDVQQGSLTLTRRVGSPGDALSTILDVAYDRPAGAMRSEQRFEATGRYVQLIQQQVTPDYDYATMRTVVVRIGNTYYVGPTTSGVEPPAWISYDASAAAARPELMQSADAPLMPLLDSMRLMPGTRATLRGAATDGGGGTVYAASVDPRSVYGELGNSLVRTLEVWRFADQLTRPVPASITVDDAGRVRNIRLDVLDLYREAARLSGKSEATATAASIKALESVLVLAPGAAPTPITEPNPSRVRPG